MVNKPGAIIIGGQYQGLGPLKCLGERGIPLALLDSEMRIGRFSKYVTKVYRCPNVRNEPSFLAFLETLIPIEIALIITMSVVVITYKFYRDPERVPPNDPHIIVSPAEGRVLYVKRVVSGKVPFSIKGANVYRLE